MKKVGRRVVFKIMQRVQSNSVAHVGNINWNHLPGRGLQV